jgi:N-acetylglucosamine-6-phosphate deacetylase
MAMLVTAARLWDGQRFVDQPAVQIENGRVVSLSEANLAEHANILDFPSATLAPAFFDVHIHGAAGHDVMEATPEALCAIGTFLASKGTGSYLATTVTGPLDATLSSVAGLARAIRNPSLVARGNQAVALPVGIHLEGPFLSHEKCGVQPVEHMLAPDIGTFDRIFEAAEGCVRLMTIAPELPGAIELIRHAVSRGVRISLGHSNATAAETGKAIAAGAVSATHTFNAMRALDHREPGILGTVLITNSLYAELICDGIHVAPEMVRLWYRVKGSRRGILVTDAMSAAGMPDGEYRLGGFAVQVAGGKATARGVLAGSVLTLDRALANFLEYAAAPLAEALPMLTTNPTAMLGLECGSLAADGSLAAGQPANLVALDDAGRLLASIVNGNLAAHSNR